MTHSLNESRKVDVRGSRIVLWVISVIAALASVSAGYLNGTVNGDVPRPAAETGAGVYSTATILSVVSAVSGAVTIVLWAVSRIL